MNLVLFGSPVVLNLYVGGGGGGGRHDFREIEVREVCGEGS